MKWWWKQTVDKRKRWVRRERLLSLIGSLPLRICCPFFDAWKSDREGQKSGGRAKKVDSEKIWARRGRQAHFLAVSHWSSMPGNYGEGRWEGKRQTNRETERVWCYPKIVNDGHRESTDFTVSVIKECRKATQRKITVADNLQQV